VENQPVVRIQPEGLGDGFFKLQLDLKHILAGCEARPVANAEDVRVDRERLFAECRVEDHVRCLAPDAG